jgi:energy-coupling factor transport system permease protein
VRNFGSYHPLILMLYFASVIMTSMFTLNPVISVTALCGAALFLSTVSGAREARKLILIYVPMLILFSVTNPFFSHNGATTLFYLGNNSITLESLLYGAVSGVTVISVMLWYKAYIETVTSDKFLYVFGRLMPKASLVISTVFRFIPMFLRQSKRVASSQKAMGLYASGGRFPRARGAMRVISALVTWSLENAMDTAASMKARGYGQRCRSGYSIYSFGRHDAALLLLCAVLAAATLVCNAFFRVEYIFYPVIVAPEHGKLLYVFYISYAALVFLPCLIELKEKAKWKYFELKI